jgi:hypothetical protein
MSNIAVCQGWECWPCCLPMSRNVVFNLMPWLQLNYLTECLDQNTSYTLYSQTVSQKTASLELGCLLLCSHESAIGPSSEAN